MTYQHKTRRGELLSRLEHRRDEPGLYQVEGRQVRRLPDGPRRGQWVVVPAFPDDNFAGPYANFQEALEAVAQVSGVQRGSRQAPR